VAAAREPRVRRKRGIRESLLSIALGLEAVVVFFMTLTAFGLKALPPAVAFGGGAALLLALVIGARMQRYRWGHWVGWVLQAALIATGFILPIMFVIGAGFAAIYVYCYIKARQLEARADRPPEEEPA
jgi:hypothetical protein